MIHASNNLVISFCMRGSSDGCTFLIFCWNGLTPSLIGITSWIIWVYYVFRSSYVHVNTYWYCLNRQTKACCSWYVQHTPRLMNFGYCFIPKLICLYIMHQCSQVAPKMNTKKQPPKQSGWYNLRSQGAPLRLGRWRKAWTIEEGRSTNCPKEKKKKKSLER